MKTLAAACFATLLFALPAVAFAQKAPTPKELDPPSVSSPLEAFDTEHVKEIRLLLSGYHGLPDKKAFERYPNAEAIVFAMASDTKSFPLYRDRALGALKYWPSEAAFDLYRKVVDSDETRSATRHRVMRLLGETFGARALPVLRGHLRSQDIQFRITAAYAVGAVGTDSAFEALERAAQMEKSDIVLEAIEKAGRHVR